MIVPDTARLVIARELRESLRRRSFWIVIGLFVLASTAVVVVPEFLGDDSDAHTVAVVDDEGGFAGTLRQIASGTGTAVEIGSVDGLEAGRAAVEGGDVDVVVDTTVQPPSVVTRSADSSTVLLVRQALAVFAFGAALEDAGIDRSQVDRAVASTDPVIEELEPVDDARRGVSAIVTIVLYLLLLLLSTGVATGVAIEKSNRVSEVLLAIVPARHLLFGKVAGVAIIGALTLLAGALPVVVRALLGGSLPAGTGPTIAASAAWFLMGLALFLTAAGALGALVDRQEEVGSTIAPLSAVLIVAYFVGVTSPDSIVATVLAYIPFTSPMVMPARIGIGVASGVEMAVSLLLGVIAVFVMARLAELVYRRAIVRTGRRVTLRDVLRT